MNIWIAASDGDLAGVQSYLQRGISIDAQDENGYSALHAATSYSHAELVAFLLNQGAQPNIRDADGDTPLFTCEEPHVAQLLIQAGADPTVRNTEGKSAAEVAAEDERRDMELFLREHFPDTFNEAHVTRPVDADGDFEREFNQLMQQAELDDESAARLASMIVSGQLREEQDR
jgi:hypothetical protein